MKFIRDKYTRIVYFIYYITLGLIYITHVDDFKLLDLFLISFPQILNIVIPIDQNEKEIQETR